jgi:hypothetical protein
MIFVWQLAMFELHRLTLWKKRNLDGVLARSLDRSRSRALIFPFCHHSSYLTDNRELTTASLN